MLQLTLSYSILASTHLAPLLHGAQSASVPWKDVATVGLLFALLVDIGVLFYAWEKRRQLIQSEKSTQR